MVECGKIFQVGGCYRSADKVIVLGYQNPDEVLWHEIGHALFLNDKEVKKEISKLPNIKSYSPIIYPTADDVLNEKVADYLVSYRYDKFVDYKAKKLFNNKLKQYEQTSIQPKLGID